MKNDSVLFQSFLRNGACLRNGRFTMSKVVIFGRLPPNQVFQFVPGLAALHRTALSPLRSAKAAAEQRRYTLRKVMRSANLIITGGIAAFTTLLAIYTSPVGGRELHYWAMNLGLFSSAALVSWFFFATLLTFKSNRLKAQLIIFLVMQLL